MTTRPATRSCAQAGSLDAYFAGHLPPSRQADWRAHLGGCDACRDRFARHQRLAALDPAALSFEDRVGRAVGLRPRRPGWVWLAGPALAGAVGMLLLVGRGLLPGGFSSRGPEHPAALILSTPGVEVYAFRTDQPESALQTGRLPAAAELAFAYRNRGGWPYLMVFARDEAGNVYWYHPLWTDGRADPRAVPLASDGGLHELAHAVSHSWKGQQLTLCALASDRPLSVRELEQQLPPSDATPVVELLAAPGREIACRALEVQP